MLSHIISCYLIVGAKLNSSMAEVPPYHTESSPLIWDLHYERFKLKTLNQLNGRNHTMSQNKTQTVGICLIFIKQKVFTGIYTCFFNNKITRKKKTKKRGILSKLTINMLRGTRLTLFCCLSY